MSDLKIGALFAGYGGLDLAVEEVLGAELAWYSEIDKGANKILAHRYPDVPNVGDVTAVDWSGVEPIDVLTGGSPCQDLSHAGKRAGMTEGTRSNLWVAMREAIAQIRPSLVVWENVRGAASASATSEVEPCAGCVGDGSGVHLRALGRVVGDLASLGYVGRVWGLRAADVGAPHGRFRYFLAAADSRGEHGLEWWLAASREAASGRALGEPAGRGGMGALLPTPTSRDFKGANQRGDATCLTGALIPTPLNADAGPRGGTTGFGLRDWSRANPTTDWGIYANAIARWERVTRRAPAPTELSAKGQPRLSPAFSEWLMGLPAGWVTDVPSITRNEALKALGNGVCPQQAAAALRYLLGAAVDGAVA